MVRCESVSPRRWGVRRAKVVLSKKKEEVKDKNKRNKEEEHLKLNYYVYYGFLNS